MLPAHVFAIKLRLLYIGYLGDAREELDISLMKRQVYWWFLRPEFLGCLSTSGFSLRLCYNMKFHHVWDRWNGRLSWYFNNG